jgi:hypothetical protein
MDGTVVVVETRVTAALEVAVFATADWIAAACAVDRRRRFFAGTAAVVRRPAKKTTSSNATHLRIGNLFIVHCGEPLRGEPEHLI